MILFDSQKRLPIAVKGQALRFQQDIQRFLEDSMYYFEVPSGDLDSSPASTAENQPGISIDCAKFGK